MLFIVVVFVGSQGRIYLPCSFELLAGDVVHRQVVHVGLDELEGFLLNHASGLSVNHRTQLLDHITADTLPLLRRLVKGVANDLLDVV